MIENRADCWARRALPMAHRGKQSDSLFSIHPTPATGIAKHGYGHDVMHIVYNMLIQKTVTQDILLEERLLHHA